VPESTLSLSVTDLKSEIGHFLGYGRGTAFGERAWTTVQTNNITAALKSGLSQVYTPPPVRPGDVCHTWSFLTPYASITLPSGSAIAPLPDDFGGFNTPIVVASENRGLVELPLTNEALVRQQYAINADTTGRPLMAAEQPLKGTGPTSGTRSNLYVWPLADGDYTLQFGYKYLPDALTGDLPYPPGGSEHAELFKASVIAAAELQFDNEPGPRMMMFMQRLEASIAVDRRRKMQSLGRNADHSDTPMRGRYARYYRLPYAGVTYNGNPL